SIHGGNRFNIVTDEVKMEGTIRTFNEDIRRRVREMIDETLSGITAAYGAKYELEYFENAALTYNDPALAEAMLPTLRRLVGEKNLTTPLPQMVGEDFSYFQRVIPGFFYFLGVGNKAKGITAMIHTPEFDVDEESLVIGVRVMSNLLLDYLDSKSKGTTN
ncbi:MAG TPA: M20/M25/M40 family metallo-hydrolase, partial [Blastocatellia bacterium]|nr:M20/M25/M40 family metallo-hydrolase [Blastocatellia bacterium]